ncbi:MAG TPA: hypothetical protein VFB38_05350 [Chthonomonadaceae bacterium]|nr:hypothetical protein [Chthonomonadaceae bacterium]
MQANFVYHGLFLALVAALMLAAVNRWARTPETHPERGARGAMACLLAVALIGHIGVLARNRFPEGSPGFWLGTAALLPVAGAALFLIGSLLHFYRRSHSVPGRPPMASKASSSPETQSTLPQAPTTAVPRPQTPPASETQPDKQ